MQNKVDRKRSTTPMVKIANTMPFLANPIVVGRHIIQLGETFLSSEKEEKILRNAHHCAYENASFSPLCPDYFISDRNFPADGMHIVIKFIKHFAFQKLEEIEYFRS